MLIACLTLLSCTALASDDFLIIRQHAQNHCKLFQTSPFDPSPRFLQRALHAQQNVESVPPAVEYEYAPDFGFLLPNFWPVMSWSQRVEYNHYITALIKKRLELTSLQFDQQNCQPEIRIIEHPDRKTETILEKQNPVPPRLRAIALMHVLQQDKPKLVLTYFYEKSWNTGWQLEDIHIFNHSVKEHDSAMLENIIRTRGLSNLINYLQNLIEQL